MNKLMLPLSSSFALPLAASCALFCGSALADTASPLADAVENGRSEAAYGLIHQDGTDVNAAQGDGTTALHWAAYQLDAALVRELLSHGAKANTQNRYGASPLSEAV
jgi:ankyrin repeat protein